jgi:hypothetical protein
LTSLECIDFELKSVKAEHEVVQYLSRGIVTIFRAQEDSICKIELHLHNAVGIVYQNFIILLVGERILVEIVVNIIRLTFSLEVKTPNAEIG